MSKAKDEYDEGYVAGRKEAEYQKTHNVIDQAVRNIGHDPRKSNAETYKGGFEEGVKDGWKTKK